MQINKISSEERLLKQYMNNIQNYACNSIDNSHTSPIKFTRDLYIVGEKCNTSQLKQLFNKTLIQLAQKMTSTKQDNFAAIIYSFIIKTNQEDTNLSKMAATKALEIAIKNNDSVHIASRSDDLAILYKDNDEEMYLKYLNLKKEALTDVCNNFKQMGNKYKTISRPLNSKTAYVLTLIRTEIEIALYTEKKNPKEGRKELIAIFEKINNINGDYFVDDIKELNKINNFLITKLTKDILISDENNLSKSFSKTSQSILKSIKNKEPFNFEIFKDYYSNMYDKLKNNSQELVFINKSIFLIDNFDMLKKQAFTSKLYTIMLDKNINNPKNTKIIAKHGLNQKIKNKDYYGIVFFGQKLAKALKECENFSPSEYLEVLNITIDAAKNIVNNYEELSKTTKLKPKNDYIKQLIFDKVSVAKFIKKKRPDIATNLLQESLELIKLFPKSYLNQNPAIEKLKKYIILNK